MKKYIFIFLLLLTSCASKKIHVDKLETEKDSVAQTVDVVKTVTTNDKTDSTSVNTNTIVDEITITPFDSTKTIYVNNIPYKNVVLNIKKSKTKSSYNNKSKELNIVNKDSLGKTATEKSEKILDDNTKIEDKNKGLSFFWILLILIIIILWLSRR